MAVYYVVDHLGYTLASMFSFFERLVEPFPEEQITVAPKGILAFCRHYIKGMEKLLLLMALLTAGIAVGEALLYGVLGSMVDWLASQDPDRFFAENKLSLVLMAGYILVLMPLIAVAHSLVVHQSLMGNFPMRVRWQAHRYLLGQGYAFFQNEFSGRVATKLMQTALAVREAVMKLLDVLLFATVYLITTIVLIIGSDWRLSLPVLLWFPCYVLVLRFFVPRLKQVATRQADARSMMTGRIVDSYTNITTIKLFSHAGRESRYAKSGMGEFLATVHPQMRLVTLLQAAIWMINMLLVFATAALGLYLWQSSEVTPGALAIAMSLSIRLVGMSHWIMWEVASLFESIGTVQDGVNMLSIPPNLVDNDDAVALSVSRGEIEFRDLHFAYGDNPPVFRGTDLHIAAGEKVGIVGRSGAGKSTLVNLLLRFYDLDKGHIRIDGMDVREVTQESLRANIAMVTQDTSLLNRSIGENIAFGRPQASEAQIIDAARRAAAHDFILDLADVKGRHGYEAHVGERGVNLSGGQRQRIAIARVLLKDAPILVLDEATSALDSEVEASIQESLNTLMEGKTVIAIAHRLSTIAAMDRLIVLDQGRIAEQGSHRELLEQGGIYAQLWEHQSGGFIAND